MDFIHRLYGRERMSKTSMDILYQPIGLIYSPFNSPEGMPIQPPGAKGVQGTIKIFPEYEIPLLRLESIYGFQSCKRWSSHDP